MKLRCQPVHALSQMDAFFVACQERTGILMQHGVEVDVRAELQREQLEAVLSYLVCRWPRLGQTLHKSWAGLRWRGECHVQKMLRVANESDSLHRWRTQPLDPFTEPPFQLLYVPGTHRSTLAFRSHHSVADGESSVVICNEAMRILALMMRGGAPLPDPDMAGTLSLPKIISPMRLLRDGKLLAMWRQMRSVSAEARAGRSMSLAMCAREPGPIATCERLVDEVDLVELKGRAGSAGITPAWFCAAAWVRAIATWNSSRAIPTQRLVSLEVPVSLRPRRSRLEAVGNFISPLVLFGDPSQTLPEVALGLRAQFRTQMQERSHLVVPLFTAPARFLPWPLFRRLAMTHASTGFATSHFTWLDQKTHLQGFSTLSGGALEILDLHIYTPVCLHMGAALAVLSLAGRAKLVLTYRLNAFSGEDAESLLELVFDEVNGRRCKYERAVG